MKKMLMLAAVLTLAACEKKAEEAPMADSVPAMAPADTAAMMPADTGMMADSAAADTMARDTAHQM